MGRNRQKTFGVDLLVRSNKQNSDQTQKDATENEAPAKNLQKIALGENLADRKQSAEDAEDKSGDELEGLSDNRVSTVAMMAIQTQP